MPSLKQLDDFKRTFLNVGNEAGILKNQGMKPDNFPLPSTEPKNIPLPVELGGNGVPQQPAGPESAASEAEEPAAQVASLDDFDFGDLLSNPADLQAPITPDAPSAPDTPAFPEPPASPEPADEDFSLPDEDFVFPEPSPDEAAGETGDEAAAGLPKEEAPEPSLADEEGAGELPQDFFDEFNLGGEERDDSGSPTGAGGKAPGGDAGPLPDLEGFDLKGLDDIFGGKTAAEESPASPMIVRSRKGEPKGAEEINLTEEEYQQVEDTLASYPLNLRIACEELIAEQVVAPEQMAAFIRLLLRGGSPREAASLAGKIQGRIISLPRGVEKKTGAELEAEQASLTYIFVHQFLPVLRIFLFFAAVAASLCYLAYQFVYRPLLAESLYKRGYARIPDGEYERANERFDEAFAIYQDKDWFYRYAEAFRDERQYFYAEKKYEDLLRYYPRDKKGVLDYAGMETYELRNYSEADRILRAHLLDYAVNDREGLLALGDNNLAWGDTESARYENARQAYARLLDVYGWEDAPVVERMMLYFIRTDNLGEVLPLQAYFMDNVKRKIRPASLAELGGYLLDKRLEEQRGVPDENIRRIDGIRDVLQRAREAAPEEPEAHYHLARYYGAFGDVRDERGALETAIRLFDTAKEETVRRTAFRIDSERRYAQNLIKNREFLPAQAALSKGLTIYQDALDRRLLSRQAQFGRLYADMGDLEYFAGAGDMREVLRLYRQAEEHGWAPVEIQYRMGAAYYQLRQWEPALERFFTASAELPLSRRLLYALGNTAYQRGNYSTAQGYYSRLLDLLEVDRARFPVLSPGERQDHLDLAERMMAARNNLGVTMEALADRTGQASYRSGALGLYAESARAWDAITRDPVTMVRAGSEDLSSPGINIAYINSQNTFHPVPGFEPQIYLRIDKDVLEPSFWEELAPPPYRLSYQIAE